MLGGHKWESRRDSLQPKRLNQICVWVSPAETQVSSGLSWGQGLVCSSLGGVACGISPLGRVTISFTIEAPSRQPTNLKTLIPKKLLHYCKTSRAHNRFPNLGILQRVWELPGNLTLKASGIWLQNFHRTGETDTGGHKQNLVLTRTPDKGAVTPQETEPDLPVSVQQSLVETWFDSGLLQGQVYWLQ